MLPKRIREPELILPALFCISDTEEVSTTALINCLRDLLKPQGEDTQILSGRSDDKFSQKVRNLQSHGTLERSGLAIHDSQGYWQITQKGKDYLEAGRSLLELLIEQGFPYNLQQDALAKVVDPEQSESEQLNLFDETVTEEDVLILEGKNRIIKQKIYERSSKLRDSAIKHYTVNGRIVCSACGFDFGLSYGSLGSGFIEIHHQKPIFSYGDKDTEKTSIEALDNVVPVCSNCHRMIHRKRGQMLTIQELKAIIDKARQ